MALIAAGRHVGSWPCPSGCSFSAGFLTGSVGEPPLFPTMQACADGDGYDWADDCASATRMVLSLAAPRRAW